MEEVSIPAGRILAAVPLLFCLALIKPVLAVWRGRVRAGAALCVGGWLRHGSGRCGVGSSTSVYGQYYIFSRSLHSFLFPPTIPSLLVTVVTGLGCYLCCVHYNGALFKLWLYKALI